MRVARKVELSAEQRAELEERSRKRSLPARTVERVRIVLLAADGLQNQQISEELSIGVQKVARCEPGISAKA